MRVRSDHRRLGLLLGAAALLCSACGGARPRAPDRSRAAACDPIGGGDDLLEHGHHPPSERSSAPEHDGRIDADGRPIPGPPSADAVAAKRLFDAQRWSEAATALWRVAYGETGDDVGNRQLADLDYAIALGHSHDPGEGQEMFLSILVTPNHLKREDAAFQIWTYLKGGPKNVSRVEGLLDAGLGPEFPRVDLWWKMMHNLARVLLRGHREEAATILANIPQGSAPYTPAQVCLDLLCDGASAPTVCALRRRRLPR
jgi:hypothetical protein